MKTEPSLPHSSSPRSLGPYSLAVVCWGLFGVLALLGQALYRLTPLAIEPLQKQMLSQGQWLLYVGWGVASAYLEGYRGFQRAFSPRVVARAWHLAHNPRPAYVLFAPFYCMAFFHAKKKNLAVAWGMTAMIITFVVLVRHLPQPWRGIVDAGVVVGLAWGALSIVVLFVRALGGAVPDHDSLPVEAEPLVEEAS